MKFIESHYNKENGYSVVLHVGDKISMFDLYKKYVAKGVFRERTKGTAKQTILRILSNTAYYEKNNNSSWLVWENRKKFDRTWKNNSIC